MNDNEKSFFTIVAIMTIALILYAICKSVGVTEYKLELACLLMN